MNVKTKLEAAKQKIKKNAPVLIGTGIAVAASVTTLAVKHMLDSKKNLIELSDDELVTMGMSDSEMTFNFHGCDYVLKHDGDPHTM